MVKTVREIAAPEPLWEAVDRLAGELGTERDALVLQALHAFLRFHGALPEGPVRAPPPEGPVRAPLPEGSARLAPERTGEPAPGGDPPTVRYRQAVAKRVLDTARDLERAITPPRGIGPAPATLVLHGDQGVLARVERDRFVLGRGRHCDLVIDSPKVSREHAVIRRELDGWWIEDLGSSNGTWLGHLRVDRRRIADGDVYFICAEKIRCALS